MRARLSRLTIRIDRLEREASGSRDLVRAVFKAGVDGGDAAARGLGMSAILIAADPDAVAKADHSFVGHPRGLGYLAFAEAWERFSYYGMQTLLVLYMVRRLLHPGHIESIAGFTAFRAAIERAYGGPLSTIALASAIFGLYTGLVYLTPIAG